MLTIMCLLPSFSVAADESNSNWVEIGQNTRANIFVNYTGGSPDDNVWTMMYYTQGEMFGKTRMSFSMMKYHYDCNNYTTHMLVFAAFDTHGDSIEVRNISSVAETITVIPDTFEYYAVDTYCLIKKGDIEIPKGYSSVIEAVSYAKSKNPHLKTKK